MADAWEIVKQSGLFLMQEDVDGNPVRLQSREGRSSIVLRDADTPAIVVDGVPIIDIGVLRQIGASSIETLRIMDGRAGTTYYGTNAGAGVILINTKTGADGTGM